MTAVYDRRNCLNLAEERLWNSGAATKRLSQENYKGM